MMVACKFMQEKNPNLSIQDSTSDGAGEQLRNEVCKLVSHGSLIVFYAEIHVNDVFLFFKNYF
jgi:hypothetical protein